METLSANSTSEWFENWFDKWYLIVYQHRDQEEAARFIDGLPIWEKITNGDNCLDLGCGTGRHSRELVKHGLEVVGLDLSMEMLRVANAEKKGSNNLNFVRSDMRKLPTNTQFSLVVSLFTSFGYFKTDLEHLDLMKSIGSIIKPGGQCIFDLPNPIFVRKQVHDCPESKKMIEGVEINEKRWIDFEKCRVEKKISVIKDSIGITYFESVRLFNSEEVSEMMHQSSIKSSLIWGDYHGARYFPDSPRMIHFGVKND